MRKSTLLLVALALVIVPIASTGNNIPVVVAQSHFQLAQSAHSLSSSQTLPQKGLGITNSSNKNLYFPIAASNYVVLPPIIPETTNVLTATTTNYLASISSDGSVFTFSRSTPALAVLEPGEIIVGDASHNAPNGFLRKVKTITTVGQQIVLETGPTTLEEAIQQGEAHISHRLTPGEVQSSDLASGVISERRLLGTQSSTFYIKMDNVVIDDYDENLSTTNDQILANGSIEVEPTLNFGLKIRDWKLENLEFTTGANETVALSIGAKLEKSLIKKEKELARYTLSPITIMVGILPIVVIPVLTINIGVDGGVHIGGILVSVTQESSLVAGAKYVNGNWDPIGQFTHHFTFTPPGIYAGLDFKGYAGPRVTLLIYGVAGPYMDIIAYLKLEADTNVTPWWELFGGLEVPVGIRMEILGHTLADIDLVAIGVKVPLAQAQTETPWPIFGHDPSRTAFNNLEHVLHPPLKPVWTQKIDDYSVDGLTVANGMIYLSGMGISDFKNKVYALSINGEPRWTYTLTAGGAGAMQAPPSYYKNVVYFGGQHDNNLYAANAQNGNIIWSLSGIKGLYASPLSVLDNVVYAFGEQSKLYAVGTESGNVLWSHDADGWGGKTAIWGDIIVALSWNTRPTAFNRTTGQMLWQRSDITTYFSDIVISDNMVYLGSRGSIVALNLFDGTTMWSTPLPNNLQLINVEDYNLAYANEVLYIAGGVRATDASSQPQEILFALNSKTGDLLWQTSVNTLWYTPIVANGFVYAFRSQDWHGKGGDLVAIDISNGAEKWKWQPSTGGVYFPTEPIVADNYLYLAYDAGDKTSIVVAFKNGQ